jgi:hypothetical protein
MSAADETDWAGASEARGREAELRKQLRRRVGVVASVAFLATVAAAPVSRSAESVGSALAAGHCTRQAADQAILALHLEANPGDRHPAAQVLCGAFLGPGVEAMVASVRIPSCGRTGDWLVFRYRSGTWQRVFESHNGADLTAVGSVIKETQFVLRPGDAHCFPTGGTRSRTWRWNGTRFTSTAWKYSKKQQQKSANVLHVRYFKSPTGNIVCSLGDSDYARCFSRNRPHAATLSHDGTLRICTGRGCFGNSTGPPLPVLGYGQRDEFALYRCTSATTGITCISLLRGKGFGKGFRISRSGVTRVG